MDFSIKESFSMKQEEESKLDTVELDNAKEILLGENRKDSDPSPLSATPLNISLEDKEETNENKTYPLTKHFSDSWIYFQTKNKIPNSRDLQNNTRVKRS